MEVNENYKQPGGYVVLMDIKRKIMLRMILQIHLSQNNHKNVKGKNVKGVTYDT